MLTWWTGALTHSISLPTGRSVTQALKTGDHSSGLPCSLVRKRKWRVLGFASSGRGVREVFGYFRSNILYRRRIYFSGMFEAGLWQQWRLPDWDGMVASAPDSAAVACHLWLRRTFRCPGSGSYLKSQTCCRALSTQPRAFSTSPHASYRYFPIPQHIPYWPKTG